MNDRELIEHLLPLDDGPGPAPPLAPAQVDAAVASALRAATSPAPPPPSPPAAPVWLVPIAAFCLAGAAWLLWPRAPAPAVVEAVVAAPVVVEPVAAPVEPAIAAPVVEPAGEPAVVEPVIVEPVEPPATARSLETPDDLLARANALRVEHRWRDASATYDAVIARAPHSRAAYVARLSGAAIALEQLHAPRRALALYRAAASEDGDLDPQAEHGLSRALRALGDAAGERAALHRLIDSHPSSPLSGLARERLGELDASNLSETP